MKFSKTQLNLLLLFAGILLFVPFLGSVHLFDWDEINFAECAREMIVTHNYSLVQINFLPFWEKPPLFIWMQVLSMKAFGITAFAARLPDAVCGIITLLLVFNIGEKLYDKTFGLLWALAFAGSFLPHFYFKSGIIDPWFNLFIFCGIYFFILFTNEKTKKIFSEKLFFSALFIGLAIMTKGPVGLLIFGLCAVVFWIKNRFQTIATIPQIIFYAAVLLATAGLWFVYLILSGHFQLIKEFIEYQIRLLRTGDAGHSGPFYYHFVVLLIGCFPASILGIRAFKKNSFDTPFQKHFKTGMLILFWVVLILFSIVKTKIIHYSSLCYFPLTFLAAYCGYKIIRNELEWKKWMTKMLLFIASLLGLLLIILPFINTFKSQIIASGIIKDSFANANLEANAHWTGFEFLIGVFFIVGILLSLYAIQKNNFSKGIFALFFVTMITVNLAAVAIVPRVEEYSQNAAIEFYQQLKNKDCYVETLGFKSYAYLFYSDKQPQKDIRNTNLDWLLSGNIDKPAYFVCKINNASEYETKFPQLKELYRKNGFVFLEREK
ncbi:MAG: glycosyltransferase family 39 protein [Bacteroidia bacterium]